MIKVRAPFNFVPLNNKVYTPSWAKFISQDIPFENGISGFFKMTIKADSPIFVRNGHSAEEQELKDETFSSFSKFPDGRFFIPGSSLKGAVRSVLEILSMGKTQVDPHAMYSWPRDPKTDQNNTLKTKCGWLYQTCNGEYRIAVCKGVPKRIALWEIDKFLRTTKLKDYFSLNSILKYDINSEIEVNGCFYDPKTAVFKYALLNMIDSDEDLHNLTFSYDDKNNCTYDPDGDFQGTVVLTGQPNIRTPWGKYDKPGMSKGKGKDFVFPTEIDYEIMVSEETFDKYQSLYKESPDWTFRMKKIDKGIPVFLREDKKELQSFGLTYMYKVPYQYTPKDLINRLESQYTDEGTTPDLAECLFGYTMENNLTCKERGKQRDSLRGRVHFSHFVSDNAVEDSSCCLVLNGPKASYVPFYIRQNNGKKGVTNQYQTYNDGQLAGRKRYVLRDTTWKKKAESEGVNQNIHPLKQGCSFEGSVHFHNLLPEELGALLSALTFHGNSACHHQLGQAKPYGFGKVTLTLSELQVPSYMKQTLREPSFYMALFENRMKKFEPAWRYLPSLKELFTLSSISVKEEDSQFQYMEMGMKGNKNEFYEVRSAGLYLQDFSRRIGDTVIPESRLEKYQKEFDEIQAKIEKRKADEERLAMQRQAEAERQAEEEKKIADALELENRKAQRSAAGLTLDELKINSNEFKVVCFKQALNKVNRWLKDTNRSTLPDEQCDELWNTLKRLYAKPDKKEKKEWLDNSSKLWKQIAEITSEEIAADWFGKLNK